MKIPSERCANSVSRPLSSPEICWIGDVTLICPRGSRRSSCSGLMFGSDDWRTSKRVTSAPGAVPLRSVHVDFCVESRRLWERHAVLADAFCGADDSVRAAQSPGEKAQAERARRLAAFAVTVGSDGAVAELLGVREREVRMARRTVGRADARAFAGSLPAHPSSRAPERAQGALSETVAVPAGPHPSAIPPPRPEWPPARPAPADAEEWPPVGHEGGRHRRPVHEPAPTAWHSSDHGPADV